MSKRKIPNNTDTFWYFNVNPKDRYGDDCVVRAIATAFELPWEKIVREMTEMGIKYGYVLNDRHLIDRYLKSKGWIKHPQPRKINGKKYTGKEFCEAIQNSENLNAMQTHIIANIGGHHVAAIIHGRVHDIWNSTGGCIGNYWTLDEEELF